ncbi:unnamed protein product [Anisakis simplex]|uniref:MARVEL domain-containing protein n=1 Tax=Anisakis simplex TaxID=6269 RepID=A0A0M3K7K3_ANISI|nr:unnamed protein product [Anisakis simplex]
MLFAHSQQQYFSASAASTKKSYSKLAEVYSNSGDTVEFVHNFGDYCSTLVSPCTIYSHFLIHFPSVAKYFFIHAYFIEVIIIVFIVYFADIWILLLSMLGIWAVILILIGSFNIHFCHVQPMIPIYLIVAGSLLIVFVSVSIYNVWPMPDNVRPVSLSTTLACRAIQALILLGITVWLILGCIWTYGARQYVHFQDAMFEMHYCDSTTYWVAFINATLHLAFIAIGVLLIAIILALGVWKETDMPDASV